MIKIVVDPSLCEGNARCVALAPSVFQLPDDSDTVRVLVAHVDPAARETVENAVALCPRQALSLRED